MKTKKYLKKIIKLLREIKEIENNRQYVYVLYPAQNQKKPITHVEYKHKTSPFED